MCMHIWRYLSSSHMSFRTTTRMPELRHILRQIMKKLLYYICAVTYRYVTESPRCNYHPQESEGVCSAPPFVCIAKCL